MCDLMSCNVLIFSDTPVCLVTGGLTVGASKGETIALRCAVKSNPTAHRFEWEFHGSGDHTDVIPYEGRVASQGDLSRFFHTPNTDGDFGTFLCWGSNEIGRQVQPCVFHLVAAGKKECLLIWTWWFKLGQFGGYKVGSEFCWTLVPFKYFTYCRVQFEDLKIAYVNY